MTTFFQVGEIVWGKIKGYPYWPSKIIDISSNLIYTIKFYNDNSYAKLSSKFLLKYKENKNKISESNKKNKRLINAIKAADSDLKKLENKSYIPEEQDYNNNETLPSNFKMDFDNKNIQTNSNENFEPQNLEKNNNFQINKNLINKSEIMSGQNNRANIFSITKNNKNNIITINNSISQTSDEPSLEESHISNENKSVKVDTNNNHIIIDKNILNLENDEELSSLLQNNQENGNKTESGKSLKKIEDEKEAKEEKQIKEETQKENYFIRIEIESLEGKSLKKKEIKKKLKVDDKAKEEKKKREEEDNFLYEIDEYFYKILELFNNKKFEKLDYEKEQFKRVLIYLANFKRQNFIDFLKMTNISKYIQYFVCYLKEYDNELNALAKNVYRNFHKQFNKEYFGSMRYKV